MNYLYSIYHKLYIYLFVFDKNAHPEIFRGALDEINGVRFALSAFKGQDLYQFNTPEDERRRVLCRRYGAAAAFRGRRDRRFEKLPALILPKTS